MADIINTFESESAGPGGVKATLRETGVEIAPLDTDFGHAALQWHDMPAFIAWLADCWVSRNKRGQS